MEGQKENNANLGYLLTRQEIPQQGAGKIGEQKKASKLDKLTDQINELVRKEEETEQERKTKLKLIESLIRFFETAFNSKIYVTDSDYGGFAVKKDRLQVVFTERELNSSQDSVHQYIFNKMQERDLDFENLKMKKFGQVFKDGKIVDPESIHFTSPNFLITGNLDFDDGGRIRNSHLVRCYMRLDNRVRHLLMVVKVWWFSNKSRVNKLGLTSFDLTLMVIHYLQFQCEPPVLPCLSEMLPEIFKYDSDFDQLDPDMELPEFASRNEQQLSQLLIGFLDYYANKFKFKKKAISVRVGRAIKRKQSRHFGEHDYICIEDPFTRRCTVAQLVQCEDPLKIRDTRKAVKQVFKTAHTALIRNHELQVLHVSRRKMRIGKVLHLKELADFRNKLMLVARLVEQPKLKQ